MSTITNVFEMYGFTPEEIKEMPAWEKDFFLEAEEKEEDDRFDGIEDSSSKPAGVKRGIRKKKTFFAKRRKARHVSIKNARPVYGRGHKHDHLWIDEPSFVAMRLDARAESMLKDFEKEA